MNLKVDQLILLGLYCILRRMMDAKLGAADNDGSSLERSFIAAAHREVFTEAPRRPTPDFGEKR